MFAQQGQVGKAFGNGLAKQEGKRSFAGAGSILKGTPEEEMFREAVAKFAKGFQPRVRAMDRNGVMDSDVIKGMFENGFMGVEVEPEYGGSGASFTSAIIGMSNFF